MEDWLAYHWALWFAGQGIRVFPLHGIVEVDGRWIDPTTGAVANKEDGSGKMPKGPWKEMATTEAQIIRDWWLEDPDCNYGVMLEDGLVVVDCDTDDALDRFEEAYANIEGEQASTFTVRTARGVHFYFRGTSRTFKLAPDTDLKASGGYVVGPGSRSWSGTLYKANLDVVDFAPAPSWICQESRTRPEAIVDREAFRLRGGSRNNDLTRLAGALIEFGIDHDKVEDWCRDFNETRSDEPLDEHELLTTVFTSLRTWELGERLIAQRDLADMLGAESEWRGPTHAVASRFFENKADMLMWREPEWLIEKMLPTSGIWQLFADSYTGKTFFVLDLALSICNQKAWLGNEMVLREEDGELRDHVLYVLSEGAFDFRQRIEAWIQVNGGDYDKLIVARQKSMDLASPEGWLKVVSEFGDDPRFAPLKKRIGLVIIDTQSMLLDTNENDNREMSHAASVLQDASSFIGAPILLVHHTSKAGSNRGASSFQAAMDIVMKLEVSNDDPTVRIMRFVKVKGAQLPPFEYHFTLDDVVDGVDLASAVIVRTNNPQAQLEAEVDERVEQARQILLTRGEVTFSQLRLELDLGDKQSKGFRRFKNLVENDPRFVVGPDQFNRSPYIRLVPGPRV